MTKVYKFRVLSYTCTPSKPPKTGALLTRDGRVPDVVVDQLARAEDLKRRVMDEVHGPQRAAFREKRSELFPDIAELEHQLDEAQKALDGLYQARRDASAKARKKVEFSEAQAAEVAELRKRRAALVARIQPLAKEANRSDAMKAFAEVQKLERNKAVRALVNSTSLNPTTSDFVVAACAQAAQRTKGTPSFRGYTGEGGPFVRLTKVTGGSKNVKTVAQVFDGKCAKVRLERPEKRGRRYKASLLTLRVTGVEAHDGDLVDLFGFDVHCRVVLHRPMPESGRLLSVYLKRERHGPDWAFYALFTVQTDEEVAPHPATGRSCRVDVSYAKGDGAVATVTQLAGAVGETSLTLPPDLVRKFTHETPRSRADQEFETLVDRVATFRENAAGVPQWFRDATASARQWRGRGRMVKLLAKWSTDRFPGDEAIFEACWGRNPAPRGRWAPAPASMSHVKHLDDWYKHEQRRALARRKEQYRVWAKEIALAHDEVALADPNLKKVAESDSTYDQVQKNRHNLGLYQFFQALEQACKNAGTKFRKLKVGE